MLLRSNQLLEHLPHSVYDVGAELARGDSDMKEYVGGIGKVDPRELLGFIAVVGKPDDAISLAVLDCPACFSFKPIRALFCL